MDVYPEALEIGPFSGLAALHKNSSQVEGSLVGSGSCLSHVRGFDGLPTYVEMNEILSECEAEEGDRCDIPIADSGGQLVAAGFAGGSGVLPKPGRGAWRALASSRGGLRGEVGAVEWDQYVLAESLGLGRSGGEFVLFKCFNDEDHGMGDLVDFEERPEVGGTSTPRELDARALTVTRDGNGIRFQDFREGVNQISSSDWGGWPLSGPRTVQWCCNYILQTDGHPRARHTRWKRGAGLGAGDIGVAEHEVAMRCLENAISYDQLNVGELACMELLLRRAQLSELKHKGRLLQVGAANDYGADEYLYMGTNATRGQVMVAPELEEFVSSQLQKEGSVLKERRKLIEERSGEGAGQLLQCISACVPGLAARPCWVSDRAGCVRSQHLVGLPMNVPRELFPLPLPFPDSSGNDFLDSSAACRAVRRRANASANWRLWANETTRSLSRMRGCSDFDSTVYKPSVGQLKILERISDLGLSWALRRPSGAWLRPGRRPEGEEPASDDSVPEKPHSDSALIHNKWEYARFCSSLFNANMLEVGDYEEPAVGVFFVLKKDRSLRLILDTRCVDSLFVKPKHAHLPLPAAWAAVRTRADAPLYLAQMDVNSAFFRVRAPPGLSKFFRLPPVDVDAQRAVNPTAAQGLSGKRATPRLSVLAMGWSWSLYFCQEMVSTATMSAGFLDSDMLLDKRESPNFRELELSTTKAAVYVDNVGVFGQDKSSVDNQSHEVLSALERAGLACKGVERAGGQQEFTGLVIDSTSGTIFRSCPKAPALPPAGWRCGRAAALLLILVVAAEAANADHEAESAYFDDMSDVDMRALWLDGTLAPTSVDTPPLGAHPAGDAARALHDNPTGVGFLTGLRRRARRSPAPRSRAPERAAAAPARSRTPERSAPTTSAPEAPASPGDPVPAPAGPPSVRFEAPPVPESPKPPTSPPMPLGRYFIARAKVHWPEGAQWMIFRGRAADAAAASAVAEYLDGALALEVEDPTGPAIRFLVKPEMLHHAPMGCEELGISVSATNVPEKVWHKLAAWHGLPVGGRAGPLSEARWRLLREKVVRWHPEGGVAPSPSFEARAAEGPPATQADSAPLFEARPPLSPAAAPPALTLGPRGAGLPAPAAGLAPVVRPQAPNIGALFRYDQHISDLGLPPGLTTAPARYAAGAPEEGGGSDPFGLAHSGATLDANTARMLHALEG
ncbi:unnamed protein product, partial [Prorocentrum cordatum]